ncbi:spermidine synthase [Aspergillus ochraceoroseus]|uniref:Spermidine synthase n=1 Tax=Aspergillus ochraceoroseus TaxID=138278 RepID=A0A0F8VEG6_9EURO|nr:spermidine synthase [Aspergillus ochraceoroseus]
MSDITHPTIKDGWFSEQSGMWPGQAMNLKVNQILHHEKSKYQDVLVFESSDYGTVLVLDNVIQCTERDEFSYQEMITHLAMNSHPNPKKVLVIGGGDGGVLREVVKHETVEEAILCDIDEAVIRVSKKYLPGMSIGFQHPNVKVHIGDGFEFLRNRKNEFDVIITDSSDPEGPAESLFQKPYFELLRDALRDGGVITTQGCSLPFLLSSSISFIPHLVFPTSLLPPEPPSLLVHSPLFLPPSLSPLYSFIFIFGLFYFLESRETNCTTPKTTRIPGIGLGSCFAFVAENQWLHLSLITDLKKACNEVFPVAEYAYTTIPTYPSGQIGFMVCCKDATRNVKEPVRSWTHEEEERLCRYYNSDIHRASFILPNFARKALN